MSAVSTGVPSPRPTASTTKPKPQAASKATTTVTKKKSSRSSSKKSSSMPPPPAPSVAQDDSDDDDDEDVSPPGLMAQISQQVVANAEADKLNRPPPYTEPPSASLDDSATEETAEDDSGREDPRAYLERTQKLYKRATFALYIMGIVGVLGALYFSLLQYASFDLDVVGDVISGIIVKFEQITPREKVPCYFSSPFNGESADKSFCPDGGIPCPTGGVCELGKFLKCQNRYQQINKTKDGCENTSQYNMITAKLQTKLESESIHALGCDQKDEMPIFFYSELLKLYPADLVELNTDLIGMLLEDGYPIELGEDPTHQGADGVTIGLPEGYELGLPVHCRLRKGLSSFAKWILNEIGTSIKKVSTATFSFAWVVVSAYPLWSVVGFLVVTIILKLQKRRAKRAKLVLDTANLRHQTYNLLKDTRDEIHVVLHVRDHIVNDLFPNSRKDREYLIREAWPKVVLDVKLDNRVRKSQQKYDGKIRDVWQWVAQPTSTTKTRFASDKKDQ
jgi:hypothetical protein